MVLSDKEGLGRLGSVRDLAGESGSPSALQATNLSTGRILVAAD